VEGIQVLNFQYPTLGSNHRYIRQPECPRGHPILSVSYPRIEPSLHLLCPIVFAEFGDFQYPTLGSNHRYKRLEKALAKDGLTFSILPSDRTIATLQLGQSSRHPDNRAFSILPSDRTIATSGVLLRLLQFIGTFSILPSDRTIATRRHHMLPPIRDRHFQYPTLGSNHRYVEEVVAGLPDAVKAFSILPSDRTIATTRSLRLATRSLRFQYPTLGSNHRYSATACWVTSGAPFALSVSYPRIEPSLRVQKRP